MNGAIGCYQFIVVSIVSYSRRFILIALPVLAVSKPMAWYAERFLDFVLHLLPVEKVLMDRGFYDFKLMARLHKKKIWYIVLTPQKKAYKKIMKHRSGIYPYTSTFLEDKNKKGDIILFCCSPGAPGLRLALRQQP